MTLRHRYRFFLFRLLILVCAAIYGRSTISSWRLFNSQEEEDSLAAKERKSHLPPLAKVEVLAPKDVASFPLSETTTTIERRHATKKSNHTIYWNNKRRGTTSTPDENSTVLDKQQQQQGKQSITTKVMTEDSENNPLPPIETSRLEANEETPQKSTAQKSRTSENGKKERESKNHRPLTFRNEESTVASIQTGKELATPNATLFQQANSTSANITKSQTKDARLLPSPSASQNESAVLVGIQNATELDQELSAMANISDPSSTWWKRYVPALTRIWKSRKPRSWCVRESNYNPPCTWCNGTLNHTLPWGLSDNQKAVGMIYVKTYKTSSSTAEGVSWNIAHHLGQRLYPTESRTANFCTAYIIRVTSLQMKNFIAGVARKVLCGVW
jgi:hypothetical protein